MKNLIPSVLIFALASSLSAQSTLYVPDDFASIQAGITGMQNGDTLIVRDGTYIENINFNGKAITLKSENDASTTIIDGSGAVGSIVTFDSGENANSTLEGFTLTNGFVDGIISQDRAGGIICIASSPTINDCVLLSNTSWWPVNGRKASGGIYVNGGGSPTINGCTFTDNYASWGGGGLFVDNSAVSLKNCIFDDNTAGVKGGAVYIFNGLQGSSISRIRNCTFTENSALYGSGISGDNAVIKNCIFWNNGSSQINGTFQVTYSDVQGGHSGLGNIDSDPLFIDPANNNFGLQASSPCIDAGDPNSSTDPDGTIADMGAIYFDQSGNLPHYIITNLIAGQYASFDISQAGSNLPVIIGYSLTGAGPTNTPYGIVDMSQPIRILASLQSDTSGNVSFNPLVPLGASGITLYTQAKCGNLLSNSLALTVQ